MLCVAFAATASAQQRTDDATLSSAKTFKCTYTKFAVGEWANGVPAVDMKSQDFTFNIDAIDLKLRRALIVATGTAEATAILTTTGLNVFEQTPIGNFNLTTVFNAGRNGSTYLSVHSRHLVTPGEMPSVTQNYGTCEAIATN
jgi:hypothetical protein